MLELSEREMLKWSAIWEATAPKAGNVHPAARFADLEYADFILSAEIVDRYLVDNVSVLATAHGIAAALEGLTKKIWLQQQKNTNLGILLLLLPLAAVPRTERLEQGIGPIIDQLNTIDTQAYYRAINTMHPGGMGTAEQQDLAATPNLSVRQVMQLADKRDAIARQYSNNFRDIFQFGIPWLIKWWEASAHDPAVTVCGLQLEWLSHFSDTLISRKLGANIAIEASERAKNVLAVGWPNTPESQQEWIRYDTWLRADGHRRNPGTTADLIAACLYAGLREQKFQPDFEHPFFQPRPQVIV